MIHSRSATALRFSFYCHAATAMWCYLLVRGNSRSEQRRGDWFRKPYSHCDASPRRHKSILYCVTSPLNSELIGLLRRVSRLKWNHKRCWQLIYKQPAKRKVAIQFLKDINFAK